MKAKKPSKRQKAIMDLLNLIENEGLHYGLVKAGLPDSFDKIGDDDLSDLVAEFQAVSQKLENKIEELQQEVAPFLDDDSDF